MTPTPTPTQVETTAEPSTPFRRLLDAMEDYAQLPAERRRRYRYTEDPSIVGVRHELQQSWLRSATVRHRFPDGLVPAKGTPSWQRLHGRRGPVADECTERAQLPGDDHVTLWRQPSDRGARISLWVSQPYGLTADDLAAMYAGAEERSLEFAVDTWPAWHNPGSVLFVTWRARACTAQQAEQPHR
jgi:hypothetical protein